jgi:rubrerythrin
MRAEKVHAGNYDDVKTYLSSYESYIKPKYAVVYRCVTCGEVVTTRPTYCPICNAAGSTFVIYNATYFNLYAAVQGETNAAAAYRAFAARAQAIGYPVISRLFLATADAEAKHADDEWAILQAMGATVRPVAGTPTVGTTAQNLQASFDGETYEYTIMYREFLAEAQADEMTDAARIFGYAKQAEQVHAGNYYDALNHLADDDYLNKNYGVVYRCVTCGEVVKERPANCPICNAAGSTFVMYGTLIIDAETPVITTQPASVTLPVGTTHELSVEASVTDGGTLSYQWYSNETESNAGGTTIDGATGANYDAPIDAAGTFYYYVVVTNTITDNGDGGNKTATISSDVATVTVFVPIDAQTPTITAQPVGTPVLECAPGTYYSLCV